MEYKHKNGKTFKVRNSRHLKVQHAFYENGVRNLYPVIRIAGKYLNLFGFEAGSMIEVKLSPGQIVVRRILL